VTAGAILVGIILGLVVNEVCDVSPWCAHRVVRLSARLRYTNQERRKIRTDEFVALIDERPGKLFKLGTALGFLAASLPTWLHRVIPGALDRLTQRRAMQDATFLPAETMTMTITNPSAMPVAALEIGAALSAVGTRGGLVTVNGTWGSGKTSVVQVALTALDGKRTVSYNPWLWWNDHPTGHALGGLAKEMRGSNPDLARLARAWERYLSLRLPRVAWTRLQALDERRARLWLARSLRELSRPIVIVLDDLDRMLPERARQVFDVVAHTAGLPQLGYLMSFDRSVMESVLPPAMLDKCIGEFLVELAWGTLRRRVN
jgi:hypothetical protein